MKVGSPNGRVKNFFDLFVGVPAPSRKTVNEIVDASGGSPQDYYLPAEVCDPIGYDWFHTDTDEDRSVMELAGMRAICKARGANLLLNVPPDRHGRIPESRVRCLMAMQKAYEGLTRS